MATFRMRIQPIGDAVYFSAIAPGDCFFYSLQGQTTFAFAGQFDDGRKVVLVFSEGARQMPWVGYGGHPSAVFRVKDAIIRPDVASLSFDPPEVGQIISAARA